MAVVLVWKMCARRVIGVYSNPSNPLVPLEKVFRKHSGRFSNFWQFYPELMSDIALQCSFLESHGEKWTFRRHQLAGASPVEEEVRVTWLRRCLNDHRGLMATLSLSCAAVHPIHIGGIHLCKHVTLKLNVYDRIRRVY